MKYNILLGGTLISLFTTISNLKVYQGIFPPGTQIAQDPCVAEARRLEKQTGHEIMVDRCSSKEIAFSPRYTEDKEPDHGPLVNGTVIVSRTGNGFGEWSAPFQVQLGPSGHIRWWCNSTIGNFFDPGTWRINKDTDQESKPREITYKGVSMTDKSKAFTLDISSSSINGWTPERSRCRDRSSRIRVKLGENRCMLIECLGR